MAALQIMKPRKEKSLNRLDFDIWAVKATQKADNGL